MSFWSWIPKIGEYADLLSRLAKLADHLALFDGRLTMVERKVGELMALKDKFDELSVTVDQLTAATANALGRIVQDVDYLKDQIANGSGVTEEQMDGVKAKVQAVIDQLNATDPVPENPPTEPPTGPVEPLP